MITNYFKTGFRHLLRNKGYVMINIAGIGVGIAMCIVAYLNWKFDADFNSFHKNVDQLYRLTTVRANTNQVYGLCPAPLQTLAKENVTGVKDAVLVDLWNASVNVGDQSFYERFLFTESNFMQWFNFELLEGTANLENPGSVLITERAKQKYFGDENAIGQTIKMFSEPERQRSLVISGIIQTPPLNSSINFDFITNLANQVFKNGEQIRSDDWTRWRDAIFLVLENPEDRAQISEQLAAYIPTHYASVPNFKVESFTLEPMREIARKSSEWRRDALQGGVPITLIWGNSLMAILLLLTACLNFANMTVAFSGKRLKEIGVRKVMGGNQSQLVAQLLLESFIICLLSLGAGLLMSTILVDWYNQMWVFLDLEVDLMANPQLILFLALTVLLTTLMAGAYPAFYISSFNPNRIFHGSVKFGGSNLVSRILLGLQIIITLTTIMFSLSFERNAYFQQTADLGFQREGIQAVYTGDENTLTVLNNAISTNPKIEETAGVRFHIGDSCPIFPFKLKGEKHESEYMEIGENYMEIMDLRLLRGRAFDPQLATDFEDHLIVNEKFARDFFPGIDPCGQKITFFDTTQYTIIGVVANFMQDDFFDPLRPLVLKLSKPNRHLYLAIRTSPENMLETRDALQAIWKENFPEKPFDHNFQNDFFADAMEVTNNIKTITSMFSIITMLLTISGLFALLSLNILKKIKEIAVRRVLGATSANIAYIINRNYFWITLAGILIGCVCGTWLSVVFLDLIYPINAGVSYIVLIAAGAIALMVILLTISFKLLQVLRTNPADVLRKE